MENTNPIGNALADALDRVAPSLVLVAVDDPHPRRKSRVAAGLVWRAQDGLIVTTGRLFDDLDLFPAAAPAGEHGAGERGGKSSAVIQVTTALGTYEAKLVARDEATEVALLRLAVVVPGLVEGNFAGREASAASADKLRIGTFVAAAARTEHGPRASFGVISSLGPSWVTSTGASLERRIDIDGQLPAGFAGGPLIDLEGFVHGLNVRGLVPGGTTVPNATLHRVAAMLLRGGSNAPGHLGVAIQAITLPSHVTASLAAAAAPEGSPPETARPPVTAGLLVTGVGAASAAAAAGIEVGDVIVRISAFGGAQNTPDHAHLLAAMTGTVGATVEVLVVRHGQAQTLTATPTERHGTRHAGRRGPDMGGHAPRFNSAPGYQGAHWRQVQSPFPWQDLAALLGAWRTRGACR